VLRNFAIVPLWLNYPLLETVIGSSDIGRGYYTECNGTPLLKRKTAMRVMVDTNVIISTFLMEGALPDIVLNDVCENHELILCDYH